MKKRNYIMRIGVLVLTFLLIGAMSSNIYAEESIMERTADAVVFTMDKNVEAGGEYITLTIGIENNPGVNMIQFDLKYDTDAYTLVDNDKSDDASYRFSETFSANPYFCSWISSSPEPETLTGEFLKLRFWIKSNAAAGTHNFAMDKISVKALSMDSNGQWQEEAKPVESASVNDVISGGSVNGVLYTWDNADDVRYLIYSEDEPKTSILGDLQKEKPERNLYQAKVDAVSKNQGVESSLPYKQQIYLPAVRSGSYQLVIAKPGYVPVIQRLTMEEVESSIGAVELRMYGDLTRNGNVSINDAAWLKRYLCGWQSYAFIEDDADIADVNEDGKTNIADLLVLERHLAQMKGYETLPYAGADSRTTE